MKAPKKGQEDNRFELIVLAFAEYLEEHRPDIFAIETQYINPRMIYGAMKVIEVRGALQAVYIAHCLKYKIAPVMYSITPMEAKQTIGATGKFNKRKESKIIVRNKVLSRFPELKDKTEDELDAVAIGIAGLVKHQVKKLVKV